jgi:hypothetical protein
MVTLPFFVISCVLLVLLSLYPSLSSSSSSRSNP